MIDALCPHCGRYHQEGICWRQNDAYTMGNDMTPMIKPLTWFEAERGNNGYGKWKAEGYTVQKIEGLFLLSFDGESKQAWRFATCDLAQAAAQADYAARITAALDPAWLARHGWPGWRRRMGWRRRVT